MTSLQMAAKETKVVGNYSCNVFAAVQTKHSMVRAARPQTKYSPVVLKQALLVGCLLVTLYMALGFC